MNDNIEDEAAKRRELQLLLLREGYTQDEAREGAAEGSAERLDEFLELLRKDAMRFPERQIVPPGTVDLEDVKINREHAIIAEEGAAYCRKQEWLATAMAQSFSVSELPIAALQALLDVLEANGIDRLTAMADLIKDVEVLRKILEDQRERGKVDD